VDALRFLRPRLAPPAELEHNAAAFRADVETLQAAVRQYSLGDVLVAVERTGNRHRPVLRAFRDAAFDTRIVHPFATSRFRKVEHPGGFAITVGKTSAQMF
jgi:transposase